MTTAGGSGYYYNKIVIRNKTTTNINDVSVKVEKINALFRCGFIPARAYCSN